MRTRSVAGNVNLPTAEGGGTRRGNECDLLVPNVLGIARVATAILLNGTVGQIQVTDGGAGYDAAPSVTITGCALISRR